MHKYYIVIYSSYFIARVRLVNGSTPHTGRVEVYTNSTGGLNNGEWGTICDSNWNFQDTRVVCRQLGYIDAVLAPLLTQFGKGTGPIWLDNVQCLGSESDIFECIYEGITAHVCEHGEYASAECLSMYIGSQLCTS